MMRTSYDPEADAFYARFVPDSVVIETTREVAPGVMIDFDATGAVVGIEVLQIRIRGEGAADAAPQAGRAAAE